MENKGILTKVLAIAGTVLVWFPILAPILLTAALFLQEQIFRFDYLMPAELGLFAFGGGIILLVAAIRAHSHVKFIGWGLGIAVGAFAVMMTLEDVVPGSLEWGIVVGSLAAYSLAIVATGIGGILLWRDVFKSQQ